VTAAPTPTRSAGPKPAPSARQRLNLIEQITAAAVASDYAGVPGDGDAPVRPRRQRVLVAAAALALAGFVLALGVSARLLNAPVVNTQRQALVERITAVEERHDALVADITAAREELATASEDSLRLTAEGRALTERIQDLELATGYRAVQGPGAVVELSDAPAEEGTQNSELEQVLDSDVQLAVNGLWAAGAEAVAVNGQRLTAQSAIRSAASAILVNYRPLKPPYRVEAIGPEDLAQRFAATADAAELQGVSEQFGIGLATEALDQVRLPAATTPLPDVAVVVGPEEEGEDQ
jgi:uncharacterized protein YlxW (UPF0749 family)